MSRIHKVHSSTITSVKGKSVRALVSVYGNVDYQGDRVMPGAFTRTIAKWEASGDPVPVIFSHLWSDPFCFLGEVRTFRDTPQGLVVECDLDKDTEFSRQVLKLIETRRMTKWSFAYDVSEERVGADGANELLELDIIEVGPCLSGANPLTDTLSRKAVQAMLAREASGTWAGTTIPRKAVDDLRDKVSGVVESFLDDVYDRYAVPDAAPDERTMVLGTRSIDPEIERLNARINAIADGNTPTSDADLLRRVHEMSGKGVISTDYSGVLTRASALLAQSAIRAQMAGLVDAEAALMRASLTLRTIASGGEGSVEEVIAACRPLIAELRAVNPVAGDGLERTLAELAGGVGVAYVENSDRVEGSVNVTENVTDDRDRFAPKSVIDGRVDARFRPLNEPVAAVPVESGEVYRFPVVTTDPESYRVQKEDTA
jgi:HK97 family phage prohead protease